MRLQESKRNFVSSAMARSLWGNSPHKWIFSPSDGSSGGLILLWNPDIVKVIDILKGRFSLSSLCCLEGSSDLWVYCTVYGPCGMRDKLLFWQELWDIGHFGTHLLLFLVTSMRCALLVNEVGELWPEEK